MKMSVFFSEHEVQHQVHCHRKILPSMRRKIDKAQMEASAEEAAFVMSVREEVLALMPVSPDLLEEKWVGMFRHGDPSVLLEVQSAIMNRDCTNVRDIPSIAAVMNTHNQSAPLPSVAVHEMSKLEEETFSLRMKQLQYDVQACRVAKAKMSSYELQVHHTKLQYRVKVYEESLKAARAFINDNCKVITYTQSDDLLRSIQSFMSDKTERLKLDESGNVPWLQHIK